MAIVQNVSQRPISLTGGVMLAPLGEANVDPTATNEAAWITAGDLIVIDPDVDPVVPPPTEGLYYQTQGGSRVLIPSPGSGPKVLTSSSPTATPAWATESGGGSSSEFPPVAAVATANVSSRLGLQVVDGYTLTAGDTVLLTGQSTASQNGPWVAASGAWTRPTGFATAAVVKAFTVAVIQGTVHAGEFWLLRTNGSVTVDTTAQVWVSQTPLSVVSDVRAGGATAVDTTGMTAGQVLAKDASTGKLLPATNLSLKVLSPITQYAASPSVGRDALTAQMVAQMQGFVTWLSANGLTGLGYIGEIGWPNNTSYSTLNAVDDPASWNRVGAAVMQVAMEAGLWWTQWHVSARLDWNYNAVYSGPHGETVCQPISVANTQAAVLEGAAVLGGRIGVNWEDGENGFPTGAGLGDNPASNTREAAGFTFGALGQSLPFVYDDGRTTGNKSANAWDYGDTASYQFLGSRPNVSIVRMPFRWERMQRSMGGALDTTELGRLDAAVAAAGAAGLGVILDMHNFGAYFLDDGTQGVGQSIGGSTVTSADFVDFWTKMSTHYAGNSNVVAYGLCNEPGAATGWTTVSQAAVTAIRANSDTKLLMIAGPSGSISDFLPFQAPWITDTASNFRYEAHQYFAYPNYPSSFATYNAAAQTQNFVPERVVSLAAVPVQAPALTSVSQTSDAVGRVIQALSVAGIMAAPVQSADNFQRADTTNLSGTGVWSANYGGIGIQSDKAYPALTSAPQLLTVTNLKDAVVSADITLANTRAFIGMNGRFLGILEYGLWAWLQITPGVNEIFLSKDTTSGGGWLATLPNAGLVLGATYNLQLSMVGNVVNVLLNGNVVLSYTLSGGEYQRYGAATWHGLFAIVGSGAGDDGGSRWLNFKVSAPPQPVLYDATAITTRTASYEVQQADIGTEITMTASSANSLLVPPDAAVPFVSGNTIEVVQGGTGLTKIQAEPGVTLVKDSGVAPTSNQWASGKLRHLASANTWLVTGNIAASLASAWVPSLIPGLALWLRPDALSAGALADWTNEGNLSLADATQATGGQQPTVVASQVNGLSAVQFAGGTNLLLPNLSALTAGEVFIVVKAGADPGGTSNALWNMGTGTTTFYPFSDSKVYDSCGSTARWTTPSTVPGLASWQVYSVQTAPNFWANTLGGTLLSGTTLSSVGFPTAPQLGVGAADTFSGFVAEMIVFNGLLTASRRANMHAYFGAKYAISPA